MSTILSAFKSILSNSNEAGGDPTSTAPTNDAARSPATTRASTSRTQASDTSSRPQPSGSLTGSRKRSPSVEISVRPHKRSHNTRLISADEKRLCGDYTRPADAVAIPDPRVWANGRRPEERMKHKKPGSSQALKPVNTLDGSDAHQATRRSVTTYGLANDHRLKGSTAFELEFLNGQSDTIPSRTSPISRTRQDLSSPLKRRKLQHSSPTRPDVIDLDGDDSPQMLTSRPTSAFPQSISSRSRGSAESDGRSRHRRLEQPRSSFNEVNEMLTSRRSKPRRAGSVTTPHSPSGLLYRASGASSPLENVLSDDDISIVQKGTVNDESNDITYKHQQPDYLVSKENCDLEEDELQFEHPATRSHYFPSSSRINTSTSAERRNGVADHPKSAPRTDNLRNTFIRGVPNRDVDEKDELADDPTELHIKRSNKSSRATLSTNRVVQKVSKNSESRWPLRYVKSYEHEYRGPDLYLRSKSDAKHFGILVPQHGHLTEVLDMDLGRITKCTADDISRTRISGSTSASGRRYHFDLQFDNAVDFKRFRDHHVKPNVAPNQMIIKHDDHMKKAFDRPWEQVASKADDLEMALFDAKLSAEDRKPIHNGIRQMRPKRNLLLNLKAQGESDLPVQGPTNVINSVKPARPAEISTESSRPVRSTRMTKATRDLDYPIEDVKETIKYSVEHGLGPRWTKPLQYGTGRHRAIVDFDDLPRLDEDEMLNDALVDFYLIYLFDQAQVKPNSVYFFNSHFFTTLTRPVPTRKGEINYTGVHKWAKEDIFTYDHVVVPVCENLHWYLAIICNTPNISRKPMLADLDSSSPAPQSIARPVEEVQDTRPNNPSVQHLHTSSRLAGEHSSVPTDHDDINLFDEERKKVQSAGSTKQMSLNEQLLAAATTTTARESSLEETERLQRLSIDDLPSRKDTLSQGILGETPALQVGGNSSNKKKSKRKPIPMKKYPADQPIILILDSLGGSHPRTGRALKDYIAEEGLNKRGINARIEQNVFYVRDSHIPMQKNFTDCGVYLLGYLQKFFADPHKFVRQVLSREMDAEADWPEMSAGKIRDAMRNILLEQAQQQGLTRPKKEKKMKSKVQSTVHNDNVSQPAQPTNSSFLSHEPSDKSGQPAPPTAGLSSSEDSETASTTPPAGNSSQALPLADKSVPKAAIPTKDLRCEKESSKPEQRSTDTEECSAKTKPPAVESTRAKRISPQRSPSTMNGTSRARKKLLDSSLALESASSSSVTKSNVPLRGSSVDPIPIDDSQDAIPQQSSAPTDAGSPDSVKKSASHGTRTHRTEPAEMSNKAADDTSSRENLPGGHRHLTDGLLEQLDISSSDRRSGERPEQPTETFHIFEDAEAPKSSSNAAVHPNVDAASAHELEDDDIRSVVIEETPEPQLAGKALSV